MTDLPEGWTTTDLEAVIQNYQSGFASGKKDVAAGVPHLRMNNIGVKGEVVLDLVRTVPQSLAKPQYNLTSGDVMVCTTNSSKLVGKCALFDLEGRFAFSNHLTRLRPRPDIILGDYLARYLWLLWQQGEFEDKCKHWVNQSTLPKEELLSTSILLPPLDEQRRIVAKVEELLGNLEACQKRLARIPVILKRFRQSVLAAACSGRLTADGRTEQNVSEDIEHTTVEEIAEYVGGFAYKSPTFIETGHHQVIRIGNVRPLGLNLTASPVFIPANIVAETQRFRLQPNDLVISMTGTKYKRDYGHAAIVKESDGSLYLNQRVARLRCKEKVLPKFLLYWLQTDFFREFFFAGETGNVNQGNVGADGIREAPIDLPSLVEQQEIVRRVVALFELADQIEAHCRKAQAEVGKLTQSILAKALRGELVPTEAELARREGRDYEPASVLLERIRTVHSNEAAVSPTTKANRLQDRRLSKGAGRKK